MKGKIVWGNDGTPRYYVDGKEVAQSVFAAVFPPQPMAAGGSCSLSSTPGHLSDALAVHPDQVEEARESAKRKGVPTDFLPDGRAVMTSREHQRRYLRAYGFHNNDGGYGD